MVSEATGINIDTLRKVENGYSLPRYDTLSHLSSFYKINLLELLSTYNSSYILYKFYIDLDQLIDQNNFDKLQIQYEQFLHELSESDHLNLVNNDDLTQLSLLIEAIQNRYSESASNWLYAKETLIKALKVNTPHFEIDNFSDYRFNYFELRILLVLSATLGDLKDCQASNDIAEYLLSVFDESIYNSKGEDKLIIKCYAQISYNNHRLDHHQLALEYAEKGISYCLEKNSSSILPFLLFRKGIAGFHLQQEDYLESIKQCLSLLEILRDYKQLDYYQNVLKDKYNFDL